MVTRFQLPVVRVTTRDPVLDASLYLEELDIRESTREVVRSGWSWYMVELGGGVRTVTAQMLDERTDQELMEIPGLTRGMLRELRAAIGRDPGVTRHLYPNISRDEVMPLIRGAFGKVEQRFDAAGRPVPKPIVMCAVCGDDVAADQRTLVDVEGFPVHDDCLYKAIPLCAACGRPLGAARATAVEGFPVHVVCGEANGNA